MTLVKAQDASVEQHSRDSSTIILPCEKHHGVFGGSEKGPTEIWAGIWIHFKEALH